MSQWDLACDECSGACCRVISLPLPPDPWVEGAGEYMRQRGRVFNQRWWVDAPCKQLGQLGECKIYDKRPGPCRSFAVGSEECQRAIHAVHEGSKLDQVLALLPKHAPD